MKYRVAHTDPHQHQFVEPLLDMLRGCGASFEQRLCGSDQDVIELTADADAVLTSCAKISRAALESMKRCRIISRIGTGYDNVDDKAAGEMGIPVTNVPGFSTEEVAAQAMTLLLACNRKVVALDREVRKGIWIPDQILPVRRISRTVLGLVGFGTIGRAVAVRASSFGMKVIYYDPAYEPVEDAPEATVCKSLDQLLSTADYVSLHVPLTETTRKMIGKAQFELMKPSATLINTSRGGVVDEEALICALREGRIAAAGLDVLASEPPSEDNPLLAMDNVVLSPHCAGHTDDSIAELRRRAIEAVVRALRGEPLLHVVNRATLIENHYNPDYARTIQSSA